MRGVAMGGVVAGIDLMHLMYAYTVPDEAVRGMGSMKGKREILDENGCRARFQQPSAVTYSKMTRLLATVPDAPADVTPGFMGVNTTTCIADSVSLYMNIVSHLVTYRPNPPPEPEYDFVIVGGGTAGCVLANRLSEIPHWKVLLLEAGGEEPEAAKVPAFAKLLWNSSLDWGYTTVPDNRSCGGNGCSWPRGRVLGGSSTINHMIYVRGNPADYDLWQQLGNPGWSYHDVLHYFKKWENNQDSDIDRSLHGSRGPQRVERMRYADTNVWGMVKAFTELGFREGDFNGGKQEETVMRAQTFSFNGRRQSSNSAFLHPIRDRRPNLTVLTNAMVTRMVMDGKRIIAVEYTMGNRGKVLRARVKKECIISAGAINSPQILMLSGIGPREHLESLGIHVVKDLKVGYNMQDHASTSGIRFRLNGTSQLRCSRRQEDIQQYTSRYRGPLAGIGLTEVTAFGDSHTLDDRMNLTAPAIQFMFDCLVAIPPSPNTQLTTSCYYNEGWARTILMHPRSRGSIKLASTDPYDKPLIYPNYFSEQEDVDVLVRALQYTTTLASTQSLNSLGYELYTQQLPGCENSTFNSTSYWECILQEYTQTIYHPAGTCKMGPSSDSEAVVDAELKVYGIQNLRVIDASIMPTIVTGNPVAAVLTIAEKGADMIKKEWNHRGKQPIAYLSIRNGGSKASSVLAHLSVVAGLLPDDYYMPAADAQEGGEIPKSWVGKGERSKRKHSGDKVAVHKHFEKSSALYTLEAVHSNCAIPSAKSLFTTEYISGNSVSSNTKTQYITRRRKVPSVPHKTNNDTDKHNRNIAPDTLLPAGRISQVVCGAAGSNSAKLQQLQLLSRGAFLALNCRTALPHRGDDSEWEDQEKMEWVGSKYSAKDEVIAMPGTEEKGVSQWNRARPN
ncbi:hypothetical protein PR048_028254 [Dryococelus australis]|uniref:Glucose-methanol-choline oxidoreductase N-terminal domain-containing protein n=1 Tax=Dryococelus australis TaxID=614101 RepID=A0ABQ9GIT4_9NEOP|nr:hypothetical protein PR048_028254 [Dryococelus australis]